MNLKDAFVSLGNYFSPKIIYTWSVESLRPSAESSDQPSGDSSVPSCLVSDFQIVINNIERKTIRSFAVVRWYGEYTDQGNGYDRNINQRSFLLDN
jgi:hypothetical protein